MQFVVFTSQYGVYTGPRQLDITVKTIDSIGKIFAPTWDMVRPIIKARKHGVDSVEEYVALCDTYTNQYEALLQSITPVEEQQILSLYNQQPFAVLMCYCGRHDFCHRNMVAKWFVERGAHLGTMDGWLE